MPRTALDEYDGTSRSRKPCRWARYLTSIRKAVPRAGSTGSRLFSHGQEACHEPRVGVSDYAQGEPLEAS